MCELCTGEFEQISRLDVAHAAALAQRVPAFGACHIIIEDCNVDDEHLAMCAAHHATTMADRVFLEAMRGLTIEGRVSALALAANLWGADPIPY